MRLPRFFPVGRGAAHGSVLFGLSALSLLFLHCDSNSDSINKYPIPYAVQGDYLSVFDGQTYQPVFLKGVNLAVGLPGTRPGEMAATTEQYERWFERLTELGANAIRIYTLHYPRFYKAIDRHNRAHSDNPLYVLHGIWLDEDNPTSDLWDMTHDFDEGVREVVDCAHGMRSVPERLGRAYGDYVVDMSQWIIGWLVGREVYGEEVLTTNKKHPEVTSYFGQNLKLKQGNPTEAWWAERLDRTITYEREKYGVERPVSTSSWPTLDPLTHPTEGGTSQEDIASLDLVTLEAPGAPAGVFASYHIYPNYPDFMNDDPVYQQAQDDMGPNSYLGYLRDLKNHYQNMPLLVAEFGVPTSWGNAHFGHSGMHHGGHEEVTQGRYIARMIQNIHSTSYAGAINFAWIDEWWKSTWIVERIALPKERFPLWHNIMSPEPNYGLIALDPPSPNFEQWQPVVGTGRIAELRAAMNAEYFYIRLKLNPGLSVGEKLLVGFDTYADSRGESTLPDGVKTSHRHEFALVITSPDQAELYVTEAYDLFAIWNNGSSPQQLYHSVPTDGGPWVLIRWYNKGARTGKDGKESSPATTVDTGRLRIREASSPATTLDAVVVGKDNVDIRIPWTLLQFTDPSVLEVMDDNRATSVTEIAVSDGIALSVSLGKEILETKPPYSRFRWEPWNAAPPTTEREKASMTAFGAALKAIP